MSFGENSPLFLLIVPYGIETYSSNVEVQPSTLLIVPYGIETAEEDSEKSLRSLLIVPYGIETSTNLEPIAATRPFNRTLWN